MAGLYAIADVGVLAAKGVGLRAFAEGLKAAGCGVVQLRDKGGSPAEVLRAAGVLREVFAGTGMASEFPPFAGKTDKGWGTRTSAGTLLVMNDRADLGVLAGFGGVHVGQGDLSPGDAKGVGLARASDIPPFVDEPDRGWGTREFVVGVSTHTEEEVRVADAGCADYVAVGPVFATGTKADARAVVGLEGVRRARALTGKPLVAIGGITLGNAASVVEAGADFVAVISGLLVEGRTVEAVARDFLEVLR